MKEIERAIEHLRGCYLTASQVLEVEQARYHNQCLELAIQALQEKLDCQENKALELSELKEMIGEPVWCKADKIIECHVVELDEVKSPGLTGISRVFLFKHLGETWNAYKYKPNGGE